MYYIVGENGKIEGPYTSEWIRANASAQTLVGYQQTWVAYSAHPDFQARSTPTTFYVVNSSGAAEGPYPEAWIRTNARSDTLISNGQQWISYAAHPYFQSRHPTPSVTIALADRSSSWLLVRSVVYVGSGILFATLVLIYTQSFIESAGMRAAHPETPTSTLQMTLTWLNAYLIILVPAYALGLIFGGRARFSEVVFGFARAAATLYVLLPITYFMYWRWFLQQGILLKFVAIFFQFLLVPLLCLFFGAIAIKAFMKSMAFRARWRAWATVTSSVAVSTVLFLVATRWTALWQAFSAWLARQFA